MAWLKRWLHDSLRTLQLLWLAVAVFVLAWIAQFLGHRIEGRKPSFLTDRTYLPLGPARVLAMLYRKLGWGHSGVRRGQPGTGPARPAAGRDHLRRLGAQLPDLRAGAAGNPAVPVHRSAVGDPGGAAGRVPQASGAGAVAVAAGGGGVQRRAALRPQLLVAARRGQPVVPGDRDAELRADGGAAGVVVAGRALRLAHGDGHRDQFRRRAGDRLRPDGAAGTGLAAADAGVGVVPGRRHGADATAE